MEMHDPHHPDLAVPRSFGRARAFWFWRALAFWFVICGPACFGVYRSIEPTYQATSLLRVEPVVTQLFSPELRREMTMDAARPYLRTQVRLIRSDRVLDAALARVEIRNLAMLHSAEDPRVSLRRELTAEIVGDETYLIAVSYASKDPAAAAAIVNAVIDEYLDQHTRYQNTANRALKKTLEVEQRKLEERIRKTRDQLSTLLIEKDDPARGEAKVRQLDAELLRMDLQSLRRNFEAIESKLAQLNFELRQEAFRITVQDPAVVPKAPTRDPRLTWTLAVAVFGLAAIAGLSWLAEFRARRSAGPERSSSSKE